MPRISAPTLAEHRETRRAALLNAGAQLLNAGGESAVTMSAVAQQAGLSRPAVYEYFTSTDDLLAAVISSQAEAWSTELTRTINAADSPEEKLRAYVDATQRRNVPAGVQAAATEPIVPALRALGVRDLPQALVFVQACASAGTEVDATCAFILGGLHELD